jgi:ABC-type bacteriocin/lantibiotic exporter with double-glycine peptidase domain
MKSFVINFLFLISLNKLSRFIKVIFIAYFGAILELLSIGLIAPIIILIINENIFLKYPSLLGFEYLKQFSKKELIFYYINIVFFAFFLKFIIASTIKITFANYIFNLQKKISNILFFKYLLSDYSFFLKNNSSKLLRTITTTVNDFTQGLTVAFLNFFIELNIFILVFLLLCIHNFQLSIFVSIFLFVIVFLYFFFFKKPIEYLAHKKVVADLNKLKQISQSFEGIKQIRIFNKENFFYNIYEKVNNYSIKVTRKLFIYQNLINYIFELSGVFLFGFFILYFQYLNYSDEILLISIAIMSLIIFRLLPGISRIAIALQTIYSVKYSINILTDQFKRKNNLINKKKKKIYQNTIYLKKIFFNYSRTNIFKNANIFFEKNKITGLIGKSGSGKSSLLHMVTGLIAPSKGGIFIDGFKIKNFSALRDNIGFISQDNFLIDDSIQNNISIEVEEKNINFSKLVKACKLAQIYDDILLMPKKFLTVVGEKGLALSVGQRQRLAIARALYKDYNYLIFDESTSSLDKKTELSILKTIIDLKKIKTIIFVSHDLNIVKKISDRVFEIKNNKIFQLK